MKGFRKGFHLPLHGVMLSIFIIAGLVVAAFAVGIHYYLNQILAEQQTSSRYQQIASEAQTLLTTLDSQTRTVLNTLSQTEQLSVEPKITGATREILTSVLLDNPDFHAVHILHPNGESEQLVNLGNDLVVRQHLRAQQTDRWVLIKTTQVKGERQQRFEYYDEKFTLNHSWQYQTDFESIAHDLFTYPPEKSGEVNKTAPYLLQYSQHFGQTYVLPIADNDARLAIDTSFTAINRILLNAGLDSETNAYFYQQNGQLIASNQAEKSIKALPTPPVLKLSSRQKRLIDASSTLRVSNEHNWPPISFSIGGEPLGYAIDVLDYISRMTGIELHYINRKGWGELTELFISEELDLIQPVFFSKFRGFLGTLTQSFVDTHYGVMTTSDTPINHITDLNNKIVAIPVGWSLIVYLQEYYPDIDVLEVETVSQVLNAVLSGEADAGMDTVETLQYVAEQSAAETITVHPNIDFSPVALPSGLHFLFNRENGELTDIFDFALDRLPPVYHQALAAKWFNGSIFQSSQNIADIELINQHALKPQQGLQVLDGPQQKKLAYHQTMTVSEYGNEYFTIITPYDNVFGGLMVDLKKSVGLAVLILLLLLPVIWRFASIAATKIRKVTADIETLQSYHSNQSTPLSSRVAELNRLNASLFSTSAILWAEQQAQQTFTDALIERLARMIDAKSAYPSEHASRVPQLAMMLVEHAEQSEQRAFKSFHFVNEQARREFRLGAWLHDCGKITLPEHIVDKRTKLEMIYNRIHEIRMRFEVLWRDAEIDFWKTTTQQPERKPALAAALKRKQTQLKDDFAFVAQCNIGTEFMDQNTNDRLNKLAKKTWLRHFDDQLGLSAVEQSLLSNEKPTLPVQEKLLSDKPEHYIHDESTAERDAALGINMPQPTPRFNYGELHNLLLASGTLTEEERFRLNEHIVGTIEMLADLPYPSDLTQIPRYASTHHERMNGTGFPRGLTADQLSIPERILMLADIFEALTASGHAYKKGKPVNIAIVILHQMVEQNYLDRDVFELFLTSGVYRQYAEQFLPAEQINDVDINQYIREPQVFIFK